MVRRKRDPAATRAAILDAAEDLFLAHGPSEVPTSRIAKLAGVTKSLIHHHFGSKEDLWNEIKERHFEQYFEAQKQMLSSDEGPLELLHQSIIAYFRFLQQDERSVSFMSWRFVEGDDPCLAQESQLFEMGTQRILEGQEKGLIRSDLEPLSIIKAFLAMVLQWFQTKDLLCDMLGKDLDVNVLEERYLQDILTIFFDGVRARSTTADGELTTSESAASSESPTTSTETPTTSKQRASEGNDAPSVGAQEN